MDPLTKRILSRTGLVHSNLLLPPVHGVGIVYLKEPLEDAEIHLHNARKALYSLEKARQSNEDKKTIDGLEDELKDAMAKLEKREQRHFKDRFGNGCLAGWCNEEEELEDGDGVDDEWESPEFENFGSATFLDPGTYPENWDLDEKVDSAILREGDEFEFKHTRAVDEKEVRETFSEDSLDRFKDGKWYTSANIDAYMALLGGESNPGHGEKIFMDSVLMNAFANSNEETPEKRYEHVRKATEGLDITEASKIFIPINVNTNHWIMMVVELKHKWITSLNSLEDDMYSTIMYDTEEKWFNHVKDWLGEEIKTKKPAFKFEKENMKHHRKPVPLQENDYDCGVFACLFAAWESNDLPMKSEKSPFNQTYVTEMRKAIAYSVLRQTLEVKVEET